MSRSRSTLDPGREQHPESFGANRSSFSQEEGFRYGPRGDRIGEGQACKDYAIHETLHHSSTQVSLSACTLMFVSDRFPVGEY